MKNWRSYCMMVVILSVLGLAALTLNGCGKGGGHGQAGGSTVTLASKLVFSPSASGTYYVRVKRSPAAPPSAGLYGSYDLKVTSP